MIRWIEWSHGRKKRNKTSLHVFTQLLMTQARNSVCYDGYKRPKVPEVNVKGRQSRDSRQWPLNDLTLSFTAHLVLSSEWIWSNDWYFVMSGEEASKTVEIPFTKRMRKATAKIHNVSDTLVNVVSTFYHNQIPQDIIHVQVSHLQTPVKIWSDLNRLLLYVSFIINTIYNYVNVYNNCIYL